MFRGGYTMIYPVRGRTLYRLARSVSRRAVPGALVDCGTWNGGSTALLSAGAPEKEVWAFDSFQGVPPPSKEDEMELPASMGIPNMDSLTGTCRGEERLLREAVALIGSPPRLQVRAGWFDDTFPSAAAEIHEIAVLHCDSDWYQSVRLTLQTFYQRVSVGGFVVIDDYGACAGARQAAEEFRREVDDSSPLVKVDHTGRYWQKR
jgi:O-methyltransferase